MKAIEDSKTVTVEYCANETALEFYKNEPFEIEYHHSNDGEKDYYGHTNTNTIEKAITIAKNIMKDNSNKYQSIHTVEIFQCVIDKDNYLHRISIGYMEQFPVTEVKTISSGVL